jgi:hypothetical protein
MSAFMAGIARRIQKRTVLIHLSSGGFLAGLLLARFGVVTHWQYVLAALVLCVVVFWKPSITWIVLLVAAMQLGIWRGQQSIASFMPLKERIGEKVTLVGRINDDTGHAQQHQTRFHLTDLHVVEENSMQEIDGKVMIRGFSGTTLRRGDVVQVGGKLTPALGNRQAQISYGDIELIGQNRTLLERIRHQFFAGNRTALSEPQASLGMGFLIGLRALLPQGLLDSLSATGNRHDMR